MKEEDDPTAIIGWEEPVPKAVTMRRVHMTQRASDPQPRVGAGPSVDGFAGQEASTRRFADAIRRQDAGAPSTYPMQF